jgi:hypothetical protein
MFARARRHGKLCGCSRSSVVRGILLGAILAFAAAPGPAAVLNGDVDADGDRALDDAVNLLEFVFLDGSAPIPMEVAQGVPATGQATCYGAQGAIPCPGEGEPYYGQDATYRPGIGQVFEVLKPDAHDPSTWMTIDHSTGLLWQYAYRHELRTWPEAFDYVRDLRLGGFDDWRVPNVTELVSLVRYDRGQPTIDTDAFECGFDLQWYHTFWSSTSIPNYQVEAYVVSFQQGTIHYSPKEPGYRPDYVRAVRTIGEETGENGDVNGDGTIDVSDPIYLLLHLYAGGGDPAIFRQSRGLPVTTHCCGAGGEPPCEGEPLQVCYFQGGSDQVGLPRVFEVVKPDPYDRSTWYTIDHTTNLVWQFAEPTVKLDWGGAIAHCEALELGGFGDWRLPTVKELQTLINYGKAAPAIDLEYFGADSYPLEGRDDWQFWSSTAWYTVNMNSGLIAQISADQTYWVRAVRTITGR